MSEYDTGLVSSAEFITRLADKGYTKKDSAVILADVLDVIYEAISEGLRVRLIGFGEFSVIDAKPKRIVDVRTGNEIHIGSHKKIKFKPGLALKRAVAEA